eukprot:scpid67073/ scgid11382/ 
MANTTESTRRWDMDGEVDFSACAKNLPDSDCEAKRRDYLTAYGGDQSPKDLNDNISPGIEANLLPPLFDRQLSSSVDAPLPTYPVSECWQDINTGRSVIPLVVLPDQQSQVNDNVIAADVAADDGQEPCCDADFSPRDAALAAQQDASSSIAEEVSMDHALGIMLDVADYADGLIAEQDDDRFAALRRTQAIIMGEMRPPRVGDIVERCLGNVHHYLRNMDPSVSVLGFAVGATLLMVNVYRSRCHAADTTPE